MRAVYKRRSNKKLEIDNINSCENEVLSLERFEPFQNIPDTILEAIKETADFRDYNAGETIISHGQYEGDSFFIVASGQVKITIINPATGAMFMETITAGGSFGLDIILASQDQDFVGSITLNADTDSQLWVLDKYAFCDVLQNRPSLSKNLLYYLSSEFTRSRFRSFEFTTSPEVGIYELILSYVERDEITGEWLIPNLPKHRELAERAGVDESVAGNAIAILIQEKIARRNYPGMIIDDMGKLEQLSK